MPKFHTRVYSVPFERRRMRKWVEHPVEIDKDWLALWKWICSAPENVTQVSVTVLA